MTVLAIVFVIFYVLPNLHIPLIILILNGYITNWNNILAYW
ncbi:hypothetical protein NTE_01373 [Candidatus Nitrososphaera evergladensis SR1]|uniref:Uncharacterized protein n=1 Tax=Candidatus Nitrososphaera evergladensis SR1 TaxID=1459636 RepID=A0A075MPG0_9ARCH|nr:hypothetical protein NTE_01373 [Candidatus Nitrososphaera evergladensis SR1]